MLRKSAVLMFLSAIIVAGSLVGCSGPDTPAKKPSGGGSGKSLTTDSK